jgi:hypothetical protein
MIDSFGYKSDMRIGPCTITQAKQIVGRVHRHNVPSITAVFCIGLYIDNQLTGAAMCGIPKARLLMDGETLEVTRVVVPEGLPNANSMLYGACARAAKALGWKRLITYTLPAESGISLKAAGWKLDEGMFGGTDWSHHSLHPGRGATETDLFGTTQRIPSGKKLRWRREL